MPLIEQKLNSVRQKGVCIVRHCGKPARGKMCSTCRARQWRLEHPIKYTYNNIKNRAKQRKIDFDLTFDEFVKFCDDNSYMEKKQRSRDGFTIDRIRENEGYHKNNIQILPLVANIKKYYKKAS